MKYKNQIVKDILALGYTDSDLDDLVKTVRIERHKAKLKADELRAKEDISKVPKKQLNEFVRRTKKLMKGKRVTYPTLCIRFKITEDLVWEQEDYVQPRNAIVKVLKKGTTFDPGMYFADYISEEFLDNTEHPLRKGVMDKLDKEIQELIADIHACEKKLNLNEDAIWNYVDSTCNAHSLLR